jgi:hypothetical protein
MEARDVGYPPITVPESTGEAILFKGKAEWKTLMIEVLKNFPPDVLAFACHGHVTRQDYDRVLIPAVEEALKENEKLRLYYETAADFDGVDAAAVLEDVKVGVTHLRQWERFAVVTDIEWIRHAMQLFGFLIPGRTRVFSTEEISQAKAWIASHDESTG